MKHLFHEFPIGKWQLFLSFSLATWKLARTTAKFSFTRDMDIFCWSKRALCKLLDIWVLTWPWNTSYFSLWCALQCHLMLHSLKTDTVSLQMRHTALSLFCTKKDFWVHCSLKTRHPIYFPFLCSFNSDMVAIDYTEKWTVLKNIGIILKVWTHKNTLHNSKESGHNSQCANDPYLPTWVKLSLKVTSVPLAGN
jgi:hypothetical protein